MIRKTVYSALVLTLIVLDVFFINSAIEFSKFYPFKRIVIENVLSYNIDTAKANLKYKSKIVRIEDETVDKTNLFSLLRKYRHKNELNIAFKIDGQIFNKKLVKKGINQSYFLYLMFILLIANVHYIWGCLIFIISPHQYQAKIYFYSNLLLSSLFFVIVELLTYRNLVLFSMVILLLLGYVVILVGFNISNQKLTRHVSIPLLLIIAAIAIISFVNYSGSHMILSYNYYMLYLIICSMLSLAKILQNTIRIKNVFLFRRNVAIIFSIVVSYCIPVLAFLLSFYLDLSAPAPYMLSLTLVVPLLIGNGILQRSYYGFKLFQYRDLLVLFANCIVTVIGAALLYSLSNTFDLKINKALHYPAVLILMVLLFYVLYLFKKRVASISFKEKGSSANSLQDIAELVSSPKDLSYKIKNIFSEIIELTNASFLKLILFRDSLDEYYNDLESYIEYLPEESTLAKFLDLHKKIFIKYELVENSKLQGELWQFLDKRDFVLVVPIFKEKALKGALLIGEKIRNEVFTNEEINYFRAVAVQLYQLIENDKLYRDYIVQRRYEKELDNASYVQLRLFPKMVPNRERGLDINFYYRPYLRVIGDYFDFFNIDENRTSIIIGDVSGHGLSAAMILSALNSITYSMLREGMSLEMTFKEINYFLNNSFKGIELITLFIGIFDKTTRELVYINAGHRVPILIKSDKKELSYIEGREKILGADPDADYNSLKFSFEEKDELILYTDGVIEIFNDKTGEQLDEKRFLKIIAENFDQNIDGKISAIENDINYHSESIKDDITIIGVEIR